jgi:3-carboxy-cis,cis-muconate cycloisomerase
MSETMPRLEIDVEKMKQNLEVTRGLIYAEAVTMALAQGIGKAAAHKLVESICARAQKEKRHLRDVLLDDKEIQARMPAESVDGLFDPERYLGEAEALVDRVLAEHGWVA